MRECSVSESAFPVTGRSTEAIAERRKAAIAGHVGDSDTARSLLDSSDPKVRATALGALNRLGHLERDELLTALADTDAGVGRHPLERRRR